MSTFQIVVLGIFSALILVGIGVFAAFGGVFGSRGVGSVTIWGTLDRQTMEGIMDALHTQDKSFEGVTYVEKNPATYDADLINAMASGSGPDLFLVGGDDLYGFSDKVLTIPYSIIPQGSFLASFVDEGQLFLTKQGELALPFILDPLVMYWNRDLFASSGVASPPQYWNDFLTLAPKITSLDSRSNVKKSAVALGEWRNIPSAKAMLATLFMQAGDDIVGTDSAGNTAIVFGSTPENTTTNPAESALRFYTEFANPSKTSYSWNRSLPSAPDMFAAGDLGVYFGYASEYEGLRQQNPNLRFSVAELPQIEGNSNQIAYGKITGLAIARTAKNVQGALAIAQKLSGKAAVGLIAGALSLPPVRRDVAVDTTANAAAGVFVQSSLIARGWLDPDSNATDGIFQTMIESVVSGKSTPAAAVAEGTQALRQLLPR
jgi:ABC-type glycerol-3-phosphate transport system substrate-binding protein